MGGDELITQYNKYNCMYSVNEDNMYSMYMQCIYVIC